MGKWKCGALASRARGLIRVFRIAAINDLRQGLLTPRRLEVFLSFALTAPSLPQFPDESEQEFTYTLYVELTGRLYYARAINVLLNNVQTACNSIEVSRGLSTKQMIKSCNQE